MFPISLLKFSLSSSIFLLSPLCILISSVLNSLSDRLLISVSRISFLGFCPGLSFGTYFSVSSFCLCLRVCFYELGEQQPFLVSKEWPCIGPTPCRSCVLGPKHLAAGTYVGHRQSQGVGLTRAFSYCWSRDRPGKTWGPAALGLPWQTHWSCSWRGLRPWAVWGASQTWTWGWRWSRLEL